jgi:hypothetical protein
MTTIAGKKLVHAPLASANALLQAVLGAHPAPSGTGARFVLRAGEAEQPAIVTLHPLHRPEDMTPRYGVHWEAEGGGRFPIFDGELVIGADEDYNSFFLVLDGTYVPPGGVPGYVFDAVIGHHIAQEAMHGLLDEICAEAERRFADAESAKHVPI